MERLRGRGLASAVLQPKDAAEPALFDPVTRAHQRGARCGSVNNAPDIRFGPASLRLLWCALEICWVANANNP